MSEHIHVHKLVGEVRQRTYFQCACGSRRSGLRTITSSARVPLDQEWLDGADRDPS